MKLTTPPKQNAIPLTFSVESCLKSGSKGNCTNIFDTITFPKPRCSEIIQAAMAPRRQTSGAARQCQRLTCARILSCAKTYIYIYTLIIQYTCISNTIHRYDDMHVYIHVYLTYIININNHI